MPGPAKRPSSVTRLLGNPGKRALNAMEPQPDEGCGPPPLPLTAEEEVCWELLKARAANMRVLTAVDDLALADLAKDMALLDYIRQDIATKGLYVETITEEGMLREKTRVIVAELNATAKRVSSGLQQFGMTPASRSKVSVGDVDKDANALVNKFFKQAANG